MVLSAHFHVSKVADGCRLVEHHDVFRDAILGDHSASFGPLGEQSPLNLVPPVVLKHFVVGGTLG